MKPSEPRSGYRTTLYMESVDPEGLKMSDTLQNWYGKKDAQSNYAHNQISVDIINAITKAAELWSTEKAILHGVNPEDIESHHTLRSAIIEKAKEGASD